MGSIEAHSKSGTKISSPLGDPMGCTYAGCGRQAHITLGEIDPEPRCLMHSADPNKDEAQFWTIFEHILKEAGNGVAVFKGFKFPVANFVGKTFDPPVDFSFATFTQNSNFANVKFTQNANFHGVTFNEEADFIRAEFMQGAQFSYGDFEKEVHFLM